MAFKVKGELSMDGSKFFGVMAQAGAAVSRFGNQVQSNIGGRLAAAFSVGAMGMAIRRTMDYADSLEEMSTRIGVSTDKLQEWNFAAKQSGADAQKLMTFIERLAMAAGDLKNMPGFSAMGINPSGMTPEQLFQAVSSKTQGKGSTEIVQMLQGLGLSIRQIGPMVNVLASDLDAAGESARGLGAVMDQQTIHALANLNDQLSIIGQVLMGQFAPALLTAGIAVLNMIAGIKIVQAFIAENIGSAMAQREIEKNGYDQMQEERERRRADQLRRRGFTEDQIAADLGKSRLSITESDSVKGDFFNEANKITSGLDEMVAAIKNYKAPGLPTITPVETGARKSSRIAASDALVSVGNFLGSNRSVMESLAHRQVQLLQRIADNTEIRDEADSGNFGFPE